MFGIGFFELCIISIAALVFIGPQKLPEFMRQIGKVFVQVRRISNEVKSNVDEAIYAAEQDVKTNHWKDEAKTVQKELKDK
jgi:Tat protein translocase TatB subunit